MTGVDGVVGVLPRVSDTSPRMPPIITPPPTESTAEPPLRSLLSSGIFCVEAKMADMADIDGKG